MSIGRALSPISASLTALLIVGCSGGHSERISSENMTNPASGLTAAEEADYIQESAESYGSHPDVIDPPESVEVRRWVRPEEVDRVRRECIEEAGFPANPDGSFSYPGQKNSFWRTWYVCQVSYPIIPKYDQEWDRAQIEAQYEWTTKFLIPCLEDHGTIVDHIPSRDVFIATWETSPFYPWKYVPPISGAEALELEYLCLQIAPSDVLWESQPVTPYTGQPYGRPSVSLTPSGKHP